jgi:hypothetical protein
MQKRYIHSWREESGQPKSEYSFCLDPEQAAVCKAKEQAEIECRIFNLIEIRVPSALNATQICNFKIEERKSGGFVFFYEAA